MLVTVMMLAMAAGPEPDPVADLLGPTTAEPQEGYRDRDLFAFDEAELTVRGGMLWFSSDFEADPEPCGGLLFEVPMPIVSRGIFGLPRNGLGLFASITASQIDRDFTPPLEDPDGTLIFADFGAHLSLVRNDTWTARLYGGYQYGNYGGVSETRDGSAGLVGAGVGVNLTKGLRATWTGEAAFGYEGDFLIFNFIGLQIEF